MTTLLSATKNEYLLQAGPDYLHRETIEWLSEIEFCKTELAFLNKLLDKAFLRVKGTQKINELNVFDKKVKSFQRNTLKALHNEVIHHEQHLGALDENIFSQNEQSIREEHKEQRLKVNEFMKAVKKMKTEIFSVVEKQIKQGTVSKKVEGTHTIVTFPRKEPFNDY